MKVDTVTKEQMAELDRLAPERYGLTISRMMENAGYQIADFIRQNYDGNSRVALYAGKGNNGGDALAAARRLHNWGFDVQVVLKSQLDGIREEERQILEKLGVKFPESPDSPDIVVDGLIGYNLEGNPRPPMDEMIEEMNRSSAEVISIDVPSGFDLAQEELRSPAVEPDTVLTLAAPFEALEELEAEIWLVDISINFEAYEEVGSDLDPSDVFEKSSVVKVSG